jgi:hypothetical protein
MSLGNWKEYLPILGFRGRHSDKPATLEHEPNGCQSCPASSSAQQSQARCRIGCLTCDTRVSLALSRRCGLRCQSGILYTWPQSVCCEEKCCKATYMMIPTEPLARASYETDWLPLLLSPLAYGTCQHSLYGRVHEQETYPGECSI